MGKVVRIPALLLVAVLLSAVSLLNAQEITKKNGKVKCHYANGKKSALGRVSNYRRNGTWKYWDEQGRLHHITTFTNDTLNGQYTEYDTDGSITVNGNFTRGCKDGVWRYYYADGQPMSENTFIMGRLDGRQMSWYENGDVQEVMLCSNDQLVWRKVWYPGGKLKLVESYKNGVSDGTWVTYPDPLASTDTFPATVDEYEGGKLHGWHYAFMNGRKMEEVHYSGGEADGDCSRWDEHGHLASEEHFTAGRRDGACRYYNCSGIMRVVTFENGEQTGPQTDYGRDGDTLSITWFAAGVRDSIKTFHENGTMATRRIFARTADNQEESDYMEWDDQGHKLVYGRYIGEMKFGEWYTYYPGGTKKSLTTYNNGIVNGPYTKWYVNGNRMIEFNVLPDGSHANVQVWTEQGRPMKAGTEEYNEIAESATPGETYNEPLANRASIDKHLSENTPPHLPFGMMESSEVPKSVTEADDNEVHASAEVMPEYPGGASAMQNYIDNHLVHPAVRYNMEGTVYISYIVEKDGSLSDIHAVKEVKGAPEFTTEALRVVRSFPKMQPAMENGKPVRCRVIIPIQFNSR